MKPGSHIPATLVISAVFAASVATSVVLVLAGEGSNPRSKPSTSRSRGAETGASPEGAQASARLQRTSRNVSASADGPDEGTEATTRSAEGAPQRTSPDGPCASDMVLVSGTACPYVAHKCAQKRKEVGRERGICETFENEVMCDGSGRPVDVCMDRFEYPNRQGALPAVLLSFDEAERVCGSHDKRLCTVREWQFACEGEAILPLPTGLARDRELCHWDQGPVLEVVPSLGPDVAASLEKSDRRARSGAAAGCKSAFGVFDLTGNVREWVRDPEHDRLSPPFTSSLAGGAWGGGAATCRTLDQELPPPSKSASAGFRCCQDVRSEDGAPAQRVKARADAPVRRGFRPIVPQ